jgi:hypothetical protein
MKFLKIIYLNIFILFYMSHNQSENERKEKDNAEKLLRLKYYQQIKNEKQDNTVSFITPNSSYWMPTHIFSVSPEFGKLFFNLDNDKAPKKATSLLTIFSIWNCMIGSGTVSIPNACKQSGIVPYIVLNIVFFLICYYTCNVISKTGGKDGDYSDTVNAYFGKKFGYFGRVLQIIFCIAINLGAGYIYFIIIK